MSARQDSAPSERRSIAVVADELRIQRSATAECAGCRWALTTPMFNDAMVAAAKHVEETNHRYVKVVETRVEVLMPVPPLDKYVARRFLGVA